MSVAKWLQNGVADTKTGYQNKHWWLPTKIGPPLIYNIYIYIYYTGLSRWPDGLPKDSRIMPNRFFPIGYRPPRPEPPASVLPPIQYRGVGLISFSNTPFAGNPLFGQLLGNLNPGLGEPAEPSDIPLSELGPGWIQWLSAASRLFKSRLAAL
jgi:hypothetical protein